MLQLSDVWAGYGKSEVIKEIDLRLEPGECLVLVGLNGSGKSTLLKTMLGMVKPSRGHVLLDGKDLGLRTPRERVQKIFLLESQPVITFPMSVGELLHLSLRRHAASERDALMAEALKAVGLENYGSRNLMEMSSGEAKRAYLAHALCCNSDVIMLDEPFAHLDWKHQFELAESLKNWRTRFRKTFVLAIHELEWAVKLADRLCVVHLGKILKAGSPESTLQAPEVREVFAFQCRIDENPLDGSKRLTLGHPQPRH